MKNAIDIFRKVLEVLPVLVEVIADIQAARDPNSPGGAKVTPAELAKLIGEGVAKLGKAILTVFERQA